MIYPLSALSVRSRVNDFSVLWLYLPVFYQESCQSVTVLTAWEGEATMLSLKKNIHRFQGQYGPIYLCHSNLIVIFVSTTLRWQVVLHD